MMSAEAFIPITSAASARASRPKLRLITAAELDAKEFPSITYIVDRLVPEGVTIVAGKPKCGKSFWCLEVAVAVAMGGLAFGSMSTDEGDVLYLGLEDNERRLQRRMRGLCGGHVPARLSFATECPLLDKGGITAIEEWCTSVKRPRLIIIDVFGKVRPEKKDKEGLYDADYRAIAPLKALADRRGLAIILVHHTSKRAETADPFDMVSGTTGITGAVDTVLILQASGDGPKLYGRGRDIEEVELAMRFDRDAGRWTILGDAEEVSRSAERKAVLDALLNADGPLSPTQLEAITGRKANNLSQLLHKMAKSGEVVSEGRGRWRHRNKWENADPGKNDKKIRSEGDA